MKIDINYQTWAEDFLESLWSQPMRKDFTVKNFVKQLQDKIKINFKKKIF